MIQILGYKGKSWISKMIKFQTRSEYSHVAIGVKDTYFEAWHKGGVREFDLNDKEKHSSDTPITFTTLDVKVDEESVYLFLKSQVGKKYDFKSVLRFVSRRDVRADGKWFCSELVAAALKYGGVEIQHLPYSYLSPRDVMMSPYLKWESNRFYTKNNGILKD